MVVMLFVTEKDDYFSRSLRLRSGFCYTKMAEARAYAMRNRQGNSWFDHDGAAAASTKAPTPAKAPPVSPPANNGTDSTGGRTQMIKPTCNSNQWYKCDESPASTPKKGTPKASKQPTGDWFAHGTPSADDKKETKPRVMTSEGESYCRRDKAGSSAAWFSHEHRKDSPDQGCGAGPRVVSKEGSGNATRMRGESENWFSHDPSGAAKDSGHASKGRGIQPRNSDMHHVFHHSGDAEK